MLKNSSFDKIRVIKTFGNSMNPLFRSGDVIFLKQVPFQKIRINDIVGVKKGKIVFVHRVIYRTSDYLLTKGDANPRVDGKILAGNVLGIVEKIKRKGQESTPDKLYLFQSLLYFKEIKKVKRAFDKAGIDFAILKGLPLHLYLEKKIPRRIYSDCDLLVKENDIGKIEKIMKNVGYKKFNDSLSNLHDKFKERDPEISFYKKLNNAIVFFDIHLEVVFMMTKLGKLEGLYPRSMVKKITEKLLDETQNIKIDGESFRILSWENLLVYLCLHLFHHNYKGSYRYELIKTLIEKKRINYAQCAETIKTFRLENFVFACFPILLKYYKTRVPQSFLKEIRPSKKIKLINKIILKSDIFSQNDRLSGGEERFKLIFNLSPSPFYRKTLEFFNPQVIYSIFFVLTRRLKRRFYSIKPFFLRLAIKSS